MTIKPLDVAGVAAAVLVLFTAANTWRDRGAVEQPSAREVVHVREVREAAAAEGEQCAIYHARFGGQRAQLIRVVRGSVRNYVVLEFGRRDPASRSLRTNWLNATYGEAEHVWLGDYGSANAALVAAAQLCPAERRCLADTTDCGPLASGPTAAQIFFAIRPPTPVTPGM
jgi:hypothetical protein